jgi:hypothetical protein
VFCKTPSAPSRPFWGCWHMWPCLFGGATVRYGIQSKGYSTEGRCHREVGDWVIFLVTLPSSLTLRPFPVHTELSASATASGNTSALQGGDKSGQTHRPHVCGDKSGPQRGSAEWATRPPRLAGDSSMVHRTRLRAAGALKAKATINHSRLLVSTGVRFSELRQ